MVDVRSLRTKRLLIHLTVLLVKEVTKSTINLTAIISDWSTSSAVEHAVSDIRERLLIVLDIGGTIIKWKQEKLRMGIWKMLNKSFYKATFCRMITKVFWKMLRWDWLIRHKVPTPLSENITGWEHLRLCTQLFVPRWFKH